MPRAIIFASYLEHPVDLSSLLQPEDDIICLDGGYDIARAAHLQPKLLLGDFDSLEGSLPEDPAIEIRRYPPEKDYTDLELAFRILDPKTYPELIVIGGLGGRLDHTVANLQMLAKYTAAPGKDPAGFRRITLMDGRNQCFVIQGDEADMHNCVYMEDLESPVKGGPPIFLNAFGYDQALPRFPEVQPPCLLSRLHFQYLHAGQIPARHHFRVV